MLHREWHLADQERSKGGRWALPSPQFYQLALNIQRRDVRNFLNQPNVSQFRPQFKLLLFSTRWVPYNLVPQKL